MKITQKQLQAVVKRINEMTNSPIESYTKDSNGKYTANIGNYNIDSAYGGNKLVRMETKGGGIREVTYGFVSKKELYNLMFAFITGLENGAK